MIDDMSIQTLPSEKHTPTNVRSIGAAKGTIIGIREQCLLAESELPLSGRVEVCMGV
jgi:hypothetical protein